VHDHGGGVCLCACGQFEFRAVGASQHVARSSCILNAILADSLNHISDAVDKAVATKAAGKSLEDVTDAVLRDLYHKHKAIIFEGNGYSEEWKAEAKRRGLPSFVSTPDVLPEFSSAKNVALLSSQGILSEEEIIGHRDVFAAEYITKIREWHSVLRCSSSPVLSVR
jgi:glutamine synthetase